MNFRTQLGSFLGAIALFVGFIAVPFTSQVSAGPTIAAFACLLAIIARMIQAGGHQQELRAWRDHERNGHQPR